MEKESYQQQLKKKFQPWDDYFDLAHKWRGHVIDFTISLEQSIEKFITQYFILAETQDEWDLKARNFKRLMFWNQQTGLSRKKQIAMDLINSYYPLLLQKYPDIEKELLEIIKCRNDMAHWQIDYGKHYRWNGAKDKIIKVNKLNEVDFSIYNEQKIEYILNLCRKYTVTFSIWGTE